ncbi:serine hydrolase domain-containing protein [Halobacillus litoralis]|uniref:serine hydrolase domain-containing protein n=1 Tax=Halobacillus litoralis TaxID=45668 RepID=UPI001CFC8616|nr:serine hydrolase [Halobacillus litoralis]
MKTLDWGHKIDQICSSTSFTGSVEIKKKGQGVFSKGYGFRNRAEKLRNLPDTKFGIASGCKIFTAVAIAQLVEKGMFSFKTPIHNIIDIDFPHFSKEVTVHHLLTHTSGIPDYFNEEEMDDFEELWKESPMYCLKQLKDFLPMFQEKPMMFSPGGKFHYNNAGFIVLGLIIEYQTGVSFTDYVEKEILTRCQMKESGYYSMDALPGNIAYGYIKDQVSGTWKTNFYSVPVKGGADGGAYVTVKEMNRFWEGLMSFQLLSKPMTQQLIEPHVSVKEQIYYGYGLWIDSLDHGEVKYHVMGYDPGVSFHSCFYDVNELLVTVCSNESKGAYLIVKAVEDCMKM